MIGKSIKFILKSRWLVFVAMLICGISLTACKKEPVYESLSEELKAKMSDRIIHPIVMRIDDSVGASYFYIYDTLSVVYQPSHKQKNITICSNANGKWSAYGYSMKITEDKYSSYTPDTALDSSALKEDYIKPFLDFKMLSENKEEKSMKIAVNFAREREEWTAYLDDKNFVKFERDIVPTNIFIYDSSTKEYEVVFEAVTEEVENADAKMGQMLWDRLEQVTGKKKK